MPTVAFVFWVKRQERRRGAFFGEKGKGEGIQMVNSRGEGKVARRKGERVVQVSKRITPWHFGVRRHKGRGGKKKKTLPRGAERK